MNYRYQTIKTYRRKAVMRYARRRHTHNFWRILLVALLFGLFIIGYIRGAQLAHAEEEIPLLSPLPGYFDTNIKRDAPTYDKWKGVADEIIRVFGPDSPKAFKLLSCENGSLNPHAINHNRDGSIDVGTFQINNHWQGVNPKFLENPTVNIRIAKQLFDENHGKFNLWTCGAKLHI